MHNKNLQGADTRPQDAATAVFRPTATSLIAATAGTVTAAKSPSVVANMTTLQRTFRQATASAT
jgi:hypothetical protein